MVLYSILITMVAVLQAYVLLIGRRKNEIIKTKQINELKSRIELRDVFIKEVKDKISRIQNEKEPDTIDELGNLFRDIRNY